VPAHVSITGASVSITGASLSLPATKEPTPSRQEWQKRPEQRTWHRHCWESQDSLAVPPSNDRRGQWWWYRSESADETAQPQGAGGKRRRPKRRILANLAEALKRLACNMHETLWANLNTLYMRLERETAPSLHPAAWHYFQKWGTVPPRELRLCLRWRCGQVPTMHNLHK
jgi:hypothetical protein